MLRLEDGKEIGPFRLQVLIRLAPLAKPYGKCQSLLVATPEVVTRTGNIFHSCSAVEQFLYTVKLHQKPPAGLLVIRSKFVAGKCLLYQSCINPIVASGIWDITLPSFHFSLKSSIVLDIPVGYIVTQKRDLLIHSLHTFQFKKY